MPSQPFRDRDKCATISFVKGKNAEAASGKAEVIFQEFNQGEKI
jgi:hypothetical protein